jgi:hypothetical protein
MAWSFETQYIADSDLRTAIVNLLRRYGIWLSKSQIQKYLKKDAPIRQITRVLEAPDKHHYFKERFGKQDPLTLWIDFTDFSEKVYQALPKPMDRQEGWSPQSHNRVRRSSRRPAV